MDCVRFRSRVSEQSWHKSAPNSWKHFSSNCLLSVQLDQTFDNSIDIFLLWSAVILFACTFVYKLKIYNLLMLLLWSYRRLLFWNCLVLQLQLFSFFSQDLSRSCNILPLVTITRTGIQPLTCPTFTSSDNHHPALWHFVTSVSREIR